MAGHPDLVPDRFLDLVLYLVIQKRRRCRIPNLVPTTHTNFEFRRLYVLFEGLVNSIRCRLKRLLIRIIITRTLFFINLRVWCMLLRFSFAFSCCFIVF